MSRPVPRKPRARSGLVTEARMAWEAAFKNNPQYARHVIAQQMGIKISEVPEELAEARLMSIKLARALRRTQAEALTPILVKRYGDGEAIRRLASSFGMDPLRVSKLLRSAGVKVKAKRVTICKHGHEMTPANSYWSPQGARACRQCGREKARALYQKRRHKLAQGTSGSAQDRNGLDPKPAGPVSEGNAP